MASDWCLLFCPLFIGKVVIDAFRLTDPRMQALGQEPRQTTSNLEKPSIQVYSVCIQVTTYVQVAFM